MNFTRSLYLLITLGTCGSALTQEAALGLISAVKQRRSMNAHEQRIFQILQNPTNFTDHQVNAARLKASQYVTQDEVSVYWSVLKQVRALAEDRYQRAMAAHILAVGHPYTNFPKTPQEKQDYDDYIRLTSLSGFKSPFDLD